MSLNRDMTELYRQLGLDPKRHLPDAGLPPRFIAGTLVWVAPVTTKRNRFTHRVICQCPVCGTTLSAGRLFQHRDTERCADNLFYAGNRTPKVRS